MLILASGLFVLSRLTLESPTGHVALGLAVAGLGTGIFISPNTSALMGSAPRQRQGIAAGILATARNVGMVLGVGIAGAILTTILAGGSAPSGSAALVAAMSAVMLTACGIAVLGAFVSAARGR
jgi:hypothetical protein